MTRRPHGTFALIALLFLSSCDPVDAWNRSRQKHTMNRVRDLAAGIEQIRTTTGTYPQVARARVTDVLPASFAPDVPRNDAWGNEITYVGIDGEYWLLSPGNDGTYEFDDARMYRMGGTTGPERDCVFRSGVWWVWPEGVPGG